MSHAGTLQTETGAATFVRRRQGCSLLALPPEPDKACCSHSTRRLYADVGAGFFWIVTLGGMTTQSAHFIDFHVSEYPMMGVLAVGRRKQAEEKKNIADADAVPLQMCLRRARLPEGPTPIQEYIVFVAQIVGSNAPFGHLLDDLAKPCETVACARNSSFRWDREANRCPIDDRRRSFPGAAIEAFSAEDYSHGGFRNTSVGCLAIFRSGMPIFDRNCNDHSTLDAMRFS